jgi:hypothetical protein
MNNSYQNILSNQLNSNQQINNLLDSILELDYNECTPELLENVSKIINDIKTEFRTQVENSLLMNDLLETIDPLVKDKLYREIDTKKNNAMVNNRKTYYTNNSIEKLEMWNKFLTFIYYFVVLVFLILCFPRTSWEFIKYGLIIGSAFFYIFIINHTNLFIYDVKFKVIIFIVYFIVLLIIILFILYKIAITFKFVLINLTDTMRKIYNFSEK